MSAWRGARHRQDGPFVWAGIITATCLLLFILQKVLWLTVPLLLALLLYYFLFAPMQWLMHRGLERSQAATLVMVAFLLVLGAFLALVLPWAAGHLLDGQSLATRYVHGGMGLLERSLHSLEGSSAIFANAHLADKVAQRVDVLSGGVEHYVEPAVAAILSWAPTLLLAPFLAFFFLRDGGRFQRMLASAVPNAFFERSLCLLHEMDRTTRAYFQGLLRLTLLDTVTLALGLWWIGFPAPLWLGLICAVLAWLPFVGSLLGGLLVVLVAATDFPTNPDMAYAAVGLFLAARMLDDFVYMPMTIGRSLHMHPLLTVLMIFVGGAVAGVPGLMLVLPLLGVVMVVGQTLGRIVTDQRLMARYRHGRRLQTQQASADLLA
ncbi:MAG: AI-2E family transporter [Rhodocyclaceae bacterium]|nr:MAG: AI-2E family transporter [Rhodocyclaceae bacterium]